jgi:hypothetical protein
MKTSARWLGMGAIACVAGCGSTAGEVVRPKDPTFQEAARGGPAPVCHEVTDEGTPLIVDWNPEERGDLEAAMKQGVAVVHFDCNSIKVLQDCHVEGAYGFLGITKKEQVITLDNADQAQANLPLNGAKLGASLSRGSTLDIGLVMVGKKATTFSNVDRSLMTGRCEGATHFVQSATVGAFAMKTSAAGEVKAVADVFSFGGSASSASNKSVSSKDGDIASCQSADVDGAKAPNGCGALLRVRLLGLTEGHKAPSSASGPPKELSCSKGLVVVNGKCAAAKPGAPVCDVGVKVAGCVAQCDAGDSNGCAMASLIYGLGIDVPKDDTKVVTFDRRGCELGDMSSCMSFGSDYQSGTGVKQDKGKAAQLYLQACNGGAGTACATLAGMYDGSNPAMGFAADPLKVVKYAQRGCEGGNGQSCTMLAHLSVDKAVALKLLRRACNGNDAIACTEAGVAYEKGDGMPANPSAAKAYYKRACDSGHKDGCAHLKKIGG